MNENGYRNVGAFEEFLIRLSDIILSVFLIMILLPAGLLISFAIKLNSKGTVFYKQVRVGKLGREFNIYKFRTLIMNAEKVKGPSLVSLNDSRITYIGRILRKTRLDEVPQLINVLRGDMSLVGPRPERPEFVEMHKELQGLRTTIKPGLTGIAQIEGNYYTSFSDKMRYDYLYIKNRSLFLNLIILIRTIPVVLFKPGS